MTKLLNIDDIIKAAAESGVANLDDLKADFERAGAALAQALAEKLGVVSWNPSWADDTGFLAAFGPAHPGQPCPEVIDVGDSDGDWEYRGELNADSDCDDAAPSMAP